MAGPASLLPAGGVGHDDTASGDVTEFCRVFPDAFVVSDRPPYFDLKGGSQGRPLSAGFHLMQGYFRDDAPLCELVLDEAARRELDLLWRELDFVTGAPMRQYRDFIFFERAEPPRYMRESAFDFARSEDKDSISRGQDRAAARRLSGQGAQERRADRGSQSHRDLFRRDLRRGFARSSKPASRPSRAICEALLGFAERAYRRPLSPAERSDLLAFYRSLRARDGLSHEDAIRDAVTSVLLAPQFAYRVDLAEPGSARHARSELLSWPAG